MLHKKTKTNIKATLSVKHHLLQDGIFLEYLSKPDEKLY